MAPQRAIQTTTPDPVPAPRVAEHRAPAVDLGKAVAAAPQARGAGTGGDDDAVTDPDRPQQRWQPVRGEHDGLCACRLPERIADRRAILLAGGLEAGESDGDRRGLEAAKHVDENLGDVGRDEGHVRPLHDLAAELDDDGTRGGTSGRCHGQPPGSSSDVFSSTPSMMFIDWMA